MTNKDAVEILRSMKSDFPLPKAAQTRRAQNDALDVAIEALKAEPCEDDFEESIHKMFDHIWGCEIDHPMFQDTVGELMTAVLQAYNKARPKPCDDTISRQAAQTELMMKCERYTLARESHGMGHVEWSSDLISVADAMDAIRDLPSAQPERKRGHWETYVISMLDGEGCKCSECGFEGAPHWVSCPICDARMEVKNERPGND